MMVRSRFSFWSLLLLLLSVKTASADDLACKYDIAVEGPSASAIDIRIDCPQSTTFDQADRTAQPFLTRLPDDSSTKRFHFDLDGFAAASDHYDGALRLGRSVIVSPASILPVPLGPPRDLLISVSAPDGADAAIALPVSGDGPFVIASNRVREAGEWVLGRFDRLSTRAESELQIAVLDARLSVTPQEFKTWIADVAASNTRFWGRDPVQPKLLAVIPVQGKKGLPFGRVMAAGGATILLLVGDRADRVALYEEWVLVHEFLHLGTPLLRDTGIWFNEGIATYFEPILRARAGWKPEDDVWREWITAMPRSLPALTEEGLMAAPSRRAYYGGAAFLLLADIELRRLSAGRRGVETCLAEILADGADVRQRWQTQRLLKMCDDKAGLGPILQDLAAEYVYGHAALDLDTLWRDLGVGIDAGGRVAYDNDAPLAAVRSWIIWGPHRDWQPIGDYGNPAP